MSTSTIKFNPLRMLANSFLWGISAILSFIIIGNPANFQPYVVEDVTTETTQITVIAENKTYNKIGDPRVLRIEKLEGDEWIMVGAYECFTDDYTTYSAFGTYKASVSFLGMGMSKTLPEGEYRVAVSYSLVNRKGSSGHLGYAYFTVTTP